MVSSSPFFLGNTLGGSSCTSFRRPAHLHPLSDGGFDTGWPIGGGDECGGPGSLILVVKGAASRDKEADHPKVPLADSKPDCVHREDRDKMTAVENQKAATKEKKRKEKQSISEHTPNEGQV